MKTILTLLLAISFSYSVFAQKTDDKPTDDEEYEASGAEVIRRHGICLFPVHATRVNGLCLAFSHNRPRKINGLNIDFPGSRFTEYVIFGLSEEIYPERFASVNGLTISFNPIYNKVNGLGIFGFITEIYTYNGVMIGTLNVVKEMKGLQIGLTNSATDGKLVQIGVFNTIYSNPRWLRTLPLLNMRFKKKAIVEMDKK